MATANEILIRLGLDKDAIKRLATKVKAGIQKIQKTANVKVNLSGQKSLTSAGTAAAGLSKSFSKLGSSIRSGRIGLLALGAVLGRVTEEVRNFGIEAEKSFSLVNTIIQKTPEEMIAIQTAVEDVAKTFSVDLADSGNALFNIVSASIRGSDSLDVLRASAIAARAGMGSLATVSKAIIPIFNSFGKAAGSATDVTDVLFTTVKLGVLSSEELANSIGGIASVAGGFGVSLQEATAGIALLTNKGIDAKNAVTFLRAAIIALVKPTEQSKKALNAIGVQTGVAGLKQQGFANILKKVAQAVKAGNTELPQLFRNVRALRAIVPIINNFDQFNTTLSKIQNSAGATAEAFNIMRKRGGAAIERLSASVKFLATKIGIDLVKSFAPLADKITNFIKNNEDLLKTIGDVVVKFGTFIAFLATTVAIFSFLGPIIISAIESLSGLALLLTRITGIASLLASIIGGALVGAFIAVKAAIIGLILAPIFIGIVQGVREVIKELGGLRQVFELAKKGFLDFVDRVSTSLQPLKAVILKFAGRVKDAFVKVFGGNQSTALASGFLDNITLGFDGIVNAATQFVGFISDTLAPVLVPIFETIKEVINSIGLAFSLVGDLFTSTFDLIGNSADVTFTKVGDAASRTKNKVSGISKALLLVVKIIKVSLGSANIRIVFANLRILVAVLVSGFFELIGAIQLIDGVSQLSLAPVAILLNAILFIVQGIVNSFFVLARVVTLNLSGAVKKTQKEFNSFINDIREKTKSIGFDLLDKGSTNISEGFNKMASNATLARDEIAKALEQIKNATKDTKAFNDQQAESAKASANLNNIKQNGVKSILESFKIGKGVIANLLKEEVITKRQSSLLTELLTKEKQRGLDEIKKAKTLNLVNRAISIGTKRIIDTNVRLGSQLGLLRQLNFANKSLSSDKRAKQLKIEENLIISQGLGIADTLKLTERQRDAIVSQVAESRLQFKEQATQLNFAISRRELLGILTGKEAQTLRQLVKEDAKRANKLLKTVKNIDDITKATEKTRQTFDLLNISLGDTSKRTQLLKETAAKVSVSNFDLQADKVLKTLSSQVDALAGIKGFTEKIALSFSRQGKEALIVLDTNLKIAKTEKDRQKAFDAFLATTTNIKKEINKVADGFAGIQDAERNVRIVGDSIVNTIQKQNKKIKEGIDLIRGSKDDIKETDKLQKKLKDTIDGIIKKRVKATKTIQDDIRLLRIQFNQQIKNAKTAEQKAILLNILRLKERELILANGKAIAKSLQKELDGVKKVNDEVTGFLDNLIKQNRVFQGQQDVIAIEEQGKAILDNIKKSTDANTIQALKLEGITRLQDLSKANEEELAQLAQDKLNNQNAQLITQQKIADIKKRAIATGLGTSRSNKILEEAIPLQDKLDELQREQFNIDDNIISAKSKQGDLQDAAKKQIDLINSVTKTRLQNIIEINKKLELQRQTLAKILEIQKKFNTATGVPIVSETQRLKSFGVELQALEQRVDAVNALKKKLTDATKQLDIAKQKGDTATVTKLEGVVAGLSNDVDREVSSLKGLDTKLKNIQVAVNSPTAKLNATALNLNNAQNKPVSIQETVNTSKQTLANASTAVTQDAQNVTALSKAVTATSNIIKSLNTSTIVPKVVVALNNVIDKVNAQTVAVSKSVGSLANGATRLANAVLGNTTALQTVIGVGTQFDQASTGLENINGSLVAFGGNLNAFAGGINNTIGVILQNIANNNLLIQEALTALNQNAQAQTEGVLP